VKRVWTALALLALFTIDGFTAAKDGPTATEAAGQRLNVVVNDPANPKGMQIRRVRNAGEPWPDYFCTVYLWPYNHEHYNRTFTTLDQNSRRIQFIGNVVFATDDRWYLVLRGTKEMVTLMGRNVTLETGGRDGLKLHPIETLLRPDPAGEAWIGLVAFARPVQPTTRIMSSFSLFGNAGGVHEVLDEEAARRRFAVLRDVVEFIERIYREQLKGKQR
jgi:hypothetical protein